MQHLDLSHDNHGQQEVSDQLSTSPNSVLEPSSTASPSGALDTPAQQGSIQTPTSQQPGISDSSEDWQRASSSHNAARKKKRKQQRQAASHTQPVPSAPTSNGSAQAALPPSTTSTQADEVVYASHSGDVVVSNAEDQTAARLQDAAPAVAVAIRRSTATSQHDGSATSAPVHEPAESESGSAQSVDALDGSASLCDESQAAESAARDSEADEQSSDEEEATDEAAVQSSVASVTADFAMQNVILQMGLRLVAPHGMRIKQLSRWVLRCSACFKITKVSSPCTCCLLLLLLCTHPVPQLTTPVLLCSPVTIMACGVLHLARTWSQLACIYRTSQAITAMHSDGKASCARCGLTTCCWNNVILETWCSELSLAAWRLNFAQRCMVP